MKKKIVFIYNPFSGRRNNNNLKSLIEQHINKDDFECQIWATEKAEDLLIFTEKAIKEKFEIVVAAGGDGTINQVASRLVNTGIVLGIIPLGSGNGFARHFKIPLNTIKAIESISYSKIKAIDTVWLNRHCMVNIGGIGFDAHISSLFANNKKRGLQGYIKTILSQLNYQSQHYRLFQNDVEIWNGKAFMISIANATQWGNNVKVHSGALPDDGIFNLVIIKKFSLWKFPLILKNLFEGKLHESSSSLTFSGTDFVLKRENEGAAHVDGEPIWLSSEININIEPLSLHILSNE